MCNLSTIVTDSSGHSDESNICSQIMNSWPFPNTEVYVISLQNSDCPLRYAPLKLEASLEVDLTITKFDTEVQWQTTFFFTHFSPVNCSTGLVKLLEFDQNCKTVKQLVKVQFIAWFHFNLSYGSFHRENFTSLLWAIAKLLKWAITARFPRIL